MLFTLSAESDFGEYWRGMSFLCAVPLREMQNLHPVGVTRLHQKTNRSGTTASGSAGVQLGVSHILSLDRAVMT